MRRTPILLAVSALAIALSACQPATPPPSPTPSLSTPALPDFLNPAVAETTVQRLVEAAGSDQLLSVRVQRLGVSIDVAEGGEVLRYATEPLSDQIGAAEAVGEHAWFDTPMPAAEVDLAAALQLAGDCADPQVMVYTVGFASRQVVVDCPTSEPHQFWASDGSAITIDTQDAAALEASVQQLLAGAPGPVRSIQIVTGATPQIVIDLADGNDARTLQLANGGVIANGEQPAQPVDTFTGEQFDAAGLLQCAAQTSADLQRPEWSVTVRMDAGRLVYAWLDAAGTDRVLTTTDCVYA